MYILNKTQFESLIKSEATTKDLSLSIFTGIYFTSNAVGRPFSSIDRRQADGSI